MKSCRSTAAIAHLNTAIVGVAIEPAATVQADPKIKLIEVDTQASESTIRDAIVAMSYEELPRTEQTGEFHRIDQPLWVKGAVTCGMTMCCGVIEAESATPPTRIEAFHS